MGKERVTFQRIIDLLDSTGQEYKLISTEEEFNTLCKNIFPSLVKLEFRCVKCGEKTYKSYNSLLTTKNIGVCRKCTMKYGGWQKNSRKSGKRSKYEKHDNEDLIVYKVYKLTSLDTNKSYIGVTSKEVEERWLDGDGYKNQEYFYSDILKYGWDRFSKEVLYQCNEFTESREKEKYYIETYNTVYPNGYNVLKGTSKICDFGKEITNICQIDENGEIVRIWENVFELESKYNTNQIRSIRESLYKSQFGTLSLSKGNFWVLEKYLFQYAKVDFVKTFLKNKKHYNNTNNKNKTVYQYDEFYNLVNCYKTRREASRESPEFKKTSVLSAIRSGKMYKGFYWSY